MTDLLTGCALLLVSFVCQIAIWRIALPARQTVALLLIFSSVPLLTVAALAAWRGGLTLSPSQVVRIAFFYVAFSLAYIVCYSAIENESPTLAIVMYVDGAGAAGRTDAEMSEHFGEGAVITDRFALMEKSGWVQIDGDTIRLSPNGQFYARLFESAASIFGIGKGG